MKANTSTYTRIHTNIDMCNTCRYLLRFYIYNQGIKCIVQKLQFSDSFWNIRFSCISCWKMNSRLSPSNIHLHSRLLSVRMMLSVCVFLYPPPYWLSLLMLFTVFMYVVVVIATAAVVVIIFLFNSHRWYSPLFLCLYTYTSHSHCVLASFVCDGMEYMKKMRLKGCSFFCAIHHN